MLVIIFQHPRPSGRYWMHFRSSQEQRDAAASPRKIHINSWYVHHSQMGRLLFVSTTLCIYIYINIYIYISYRLFVEDPTFFGLQSLLWRKLLRREELERTRRMPVKMRRWRKCLMKRTWPQTCDHVHSLFYAATCHHHHLPDCFFSTWVMETFVWRLGSPTRQPVHWFISTTIMGEVQNWFLGSFFCW